MKMGRVGVEKSQFSTWLLEWYEQNRRDLPWRRDYSPYRVWIAEVMLQQTQVRTVTSYYLRWMEELPDVRAVAQATEDRILKLWEGLGYYSRALNIRETAVIVWERHKGTFPRDHKGLLDLPGIGPYTAGAIMSLAYNEPYTAVDGNVKRVFSRVLDLDQPVSSPKVHRTISDAIIGLIPEKKARSFNQALMELGATVCLPKKPSCQACPVRESCGAHAENTIENRPVRTARKKPKKIEAAIGVLNRDGKILIQKRPAGGLMAGLWEFPGGKIEDGEDPRQALKREFLEELDLEVSVAEKIAVIRHAYTRFQVTLHAYYCSLNGNREQQPVLRSAVEYKWTPAAELADYPFPAANKRLIEQLEKPFNRTRE